jgi:protein-disulfide isomerase
MRGPEGGRLVIEYADFECHFCAVARMRVEALELRLVFRHFPMRSKHPRALASACAAEAAANQGRFWELHDALYADQGRLEDPHLWQHARNLRLDVERFESDRRSEAVARRVRRDFESGVRAGVATTPTLFVDGELYAGIPDTALLRRLGAPE